MVNNQLKINHLQSNGFAFTYPCPRNLREIVKLSLLEREPSDKVRDIWMEYHKDRYNSISYVISKKEYETLQKKQNNQIKYSLSTGESPMFIVPVKNAKKGGHYILLGQGQKKSYMFTYLEDFQKMGSNAPPFFIMTAFDEMLFKKSLCLVRGDIIDLKITKEEAITVLHNTLRLYLTPNLYHKFVYNFNNDQENFNYDEFKANFEL